MALIMLIIHKIHYSFQPMMTIYKITIKHFKEVKTKCFVSYKYKDYACCTKSYRYLYVFLV
ncbi:hypothetical protein BD408DRAFT_417743 [Parasitella parasitica]|nr:hypothetical protein BD408DRAFT_417743 [Parasitella parasitica]